MKIRKYVTWSALVFFAASCLSGLMKIALHKNVDISIHKVTL